MSPDFPLSHQGGKTGVLLIHGFSSTPIVFRALSKLLRDSNYTYIAPIVAGHGTSPDDLANTSSREWVESILPSLDKLKKSCDRVIIVGVSMGGNIACALANLVQVDGIILIATPRWLQRHMTVRMLTPLLRFFGVKYYHKPFKRTLKDGSLIGGPTFSYASLQIKSVADVLHFIGRESPQHMKRIDVPTLIIQSDNDGLVQPKSGKYIFENIPAKDKRLVWISEPHHSLHSDRSIYTYILDFLSHVEDDSHAKPVV